ncbi:reverse transcriptase domain, reverse transcriptase zinc-binding domain protein [Tanacetum coccineum]
MAQMGFGVKWRKWIYACLSSASVSILINGSPSKEFPMKRGLRQGDPLSPFLFLIVAEALQVMVTDSCNKGILRGLSLYNDGANISLLQYSDDALFFDEWSKINVKHLIRILDCFLDVSGLKINILKCRLYGIGVPLRDVKNIARAFNFSHSSLPFSYLGLPVERSMRKIADWTKVINRFCKRLASWKANLLSIGGRLTLVKFVLGSLPVYFLSLFKAPEAIITKLESMRRQFFWGMKEGVKKMCWVSWNKILVSKIDGGALWRKVIAEIHGSSGGFDLMVKPRKSSAWADIVSSCNRIEQLGAPLNNLMVRKIYRGTQTLFWTDNWLKDSGPLKDFFSRLFALEKHKDCLVADRWVLEEDGWQGKWAWTRQPSGRAVGDLTKLVSDLNGLTLDESQEDKWEWALTTSRKFTVASLCRAILLRVNTNDVSAPPFS